MFKPFRLFPCAAFALTGAALLISSNAPAAWFSNTPVLISLEHIENGKRVQTPIEAKAGAFVSPTRGKEFEKWAIRSGTALSSNSQPGDINVELYRGINTERTLLCSISIRYFRDDRGAWIPHYQLNQDTLVARDAHGRFQPLAITRGGAGLMVLTSSTLPNAEGFYPSLEFNAGIGSIQIDSWVVH